ncbi:MAG: M23 family metallopeptidase, partial [Chloroflexi bacterium]|nr:M23 family metallopeptidase [Chloroflexota bacterium]
VVDAFATPTPSAAVTGAGASTATPGTAEPASATGFTWPIEGGCLPEDDNLLPGAPRPYRDGVHEGVDFYDADNCTLIGIDTEVLAAKAGTVVRADVDYQDLTPQELAELDARVANGEANDPDVLDAFRGRQIWIDHGGGVVTRYVHLNGVAEGIEEGTAVQGGDLIGYVGESGSPESVTDPGTETHLHFEIRVDEGYLGEGLPPDEVRDLYEQAFGVE